METKIYYQKLRQVLAGIADRDVVVVSLETTDGGKEGVKSETSRENAAKLIVENRARLASAEEIAAYRAEVAEARQRAEQAAAAKRIQITVLSEADLKVLKGQARAQKS